MHKTLLARLAGQKTTRHPAWFMRQAGRYLPEYREIRLQEKSFLDLCRSPKKAAEVTIQPLRRFDLDAAIVFADILLLPDAMGAGLEFTDQGPKFTHTIRNQSDLKRLHPPYGLETVGETINIACQYLNTDQAMIGFAGAPYTVACYMVEGQGSKNYAEVKKMLWQDPECFKTLLDIIASHTLGYAKLQAQAGAESFVLFDSWAGHLAPPDYQEIVLPVTTNLLRKLEQLLPTIYYPGQGNSHLSCLPPNLCSGLALDWRSTLEQANVLLDPKAINAIQGNLDPMLLSWGNSEQIKAAVHELKNKETEWQHIMNVGHGLLPTTRPEAITDLLTALR